MEKVDWTVEGMTCTNCALSVTKYLQKEGMSEVKVNPIGGEVSFVSPEKTDAEKLKKGISNLGYSVKEEAEPGHEGHYHGPEVKGILSNPKQRFFFCLPFTIVLMLHMLHPWFHMHWLMNPWIQIGLSLPVFIVGMIYFGKSAWQSLRNRMPNMDVLITIGAIASFVYSLAGVFLELGESYYFFETTASIITLVFFGNYLEAASVQTTQRAIHGLAKSQKVMANMIAFDDQHQEQIFPVDNSQLKTGDLVLIRNGEQVPADCKVLSGDGSVSEAIITGESLPITKQKKDLLIGGSVVTSGSFKAQVTAAGKETVLSGILQMVKNAQSEKPPLQKLADRISAVFVPLVLGIAAITFLGNFFIGHQTAGESMLRAIAVLVISCPCAMGLATPAAIAVGLGRAARSGVLFRNASSLEFFKHIRTIVFDKTGTLTTGNFRIAGFESSIPEDEFKALVYSLEKISIHPLAKPIINDWKPATAVKFKHIEEQKGVGVTATDLDGNEYIAGSVKLLSAPEASPHSIYILRNGEPIGWIDVEDETRPEAKEVIQWLHDKHAHTILLSGDSKEKCVKLAKQVGIDQVFAEQTPAQKLDKIAELSAISPTAMVGDGINDAPALAKASLGISLSESSQVALQSADVILMNHGLTNLPRALGLGRHTNLTIKQNLFWAFFYNIVAIPVAALGFLSPTVAALAMAFSDVILIANSARLFIKKVN